MRSFRKMSLLNPCILAFLAVSPATILYREHLRASA